MLDAERFGAGRRLWRRALQLALPAVSLVGRRRRLGGSRAALGGLEQRTADCTVGRDAREGSKREQRRGEESQDSFLKGSLAGQRKRCWLVPVATCKPVRSTGRRQGCAEAQA